MNQKIVIVQERLIDANQLADMLLCAGVIKGETLVFPCDHEMLKHINIESYDLIISDKDIGLSLFIFLYPCPAMGRALEPIFYYRIGVWEGILEERNSR